MHEETFLIPDKTLPDMNYLDWDSQPALFKRYPEFCYRIAISDYPQLEWVGKIRCITDRHMRSHQPYIRLNVPSAGNLHPMEIYLQIRNVSGVLSGIYHLDVSCGELVLIDEIASVGLEPYVAIDTRFNGFLLFFTIVPFRSSWKYGLRSWRYCYLDLGHQIGALHGVLRHFGMTPTKLAHADAEKLNSLLGMGEDEFVAAAYALGEATNRSVQPLSVPLMHVQPCDYTRKNNSLADAFRGEGVYTSIHTHIGEMWDSAFNTFRRSARSFSPSAVNDTMLETIMQFEPAGPLHLFHIVLQSPSIPGGVYHRGVCVDEGDFMAQLMHLLVDQRFIAGASMVSLFFADEFSAQAHINAGISAHEIYLIAEKMGGGCSGVGAFYDKEAIGWFKMPLLYAVATGGKT